MLLYINDNKRVEDLQERFNDCFPYLKIEFYRRSAGVNFMEKSGLAKGVMLVGSIRKKSAPGVLDIKSWYTTGRVKKDMKDQFGLTVQIFRQHNGQWIPTTYSNDLTLKQQAQLAQEYPLLAP